MTNIEDVSISCAQVLPGLQLHKTVYEEGCKLGAHAHDESRMVVVLEGLFTELSGRKGERLYGPSTILFRPAREVHQNEFPEGRAVCVSIRLGSSWMDRFLELSDAWEKPLFCEGLPVLQLARRLHREIYQPDSLSSLAIESIVLEFAVLIGRYPKFAAREKSVPWLLHAKDTIHRRYLEPVSVQEIAAEVAVHPVHLIRSFRTHYGCTPAEYIRKLRMEYACNLVSTTGRSLACIAQESGFYDQSHFSRLFKRHTGLSPAKYRKTRCARSSPSRHPDSQVVEIKPR